MRRNVSVNSTLPNFDDWRELPSIAIWEIAALMQGFDPRALHNVAVRDPQDPSNSYGVPPDMSWEIRRLTSAVKTGGLVTAPPGVVAPNKETEILKTSLVLWLRTQGEAHLADELDTPWSTNHSTPPGTLIPSKPGLADPERRLNALRALGGVAKWTFYRGKQQWRFKKIKELVAQEKAAKRPRCDEKTIRRDLAEAAQAESQAKASGTTP